jgi:signal transduction histidine kinase
MSLDFKWLFERSPGCYLALAADLTILAASDDYLRAEKTSREQILGLKLFQVLPVDARDLVATPVSVQRSMEDVRRLVAGRVASGAAPSQPPKREGDGHDGAGNSPAPQLDEAILVRLVRSTNGPWQGDTSRAIPDAASELNRELNSALNAVLGFAQLLRYDRREVLSERQCARIDQVLEGGKQLQRLVAQASTWLAATAD